jgi:YD repeat-containing protein
MFSAATSGHAQSVTVTYGYDALGRVVSVTYSNGSMVIYSYDPAGNRTQTSTVGACGVWGSFNWGAATWCSAGGANATPKQNGRFASNQSESAPTGATPPTQTAGGVRKVNGPPIQAPTLASIVATSSGQLQAPAESHRQTEASLSALAQ